MVTNSQCLGKKQVSPSRHMSGQARPLRTSNHQVLPIEHSNCPNSQTQTPPYRVKSPSSGLEIPPIPTLKSLLPLLKKLYKPCVLHSSCCFSSEVSGMRFAVQCNSVVFLGSWLPGLLSIQAATLTLTLSLSSRGACAAPRSRAGRLSYCGTLSFTPVHQQQTQLPAWHLIHQQQLGKFPLWSDQGSDC